jgi:putative proteasome-type protease
MTYCVGVLLEQGVVFASDSRTNAGVDNIAKFCKMSVFERAGDRAIVLLSSGSLAGTQAVISLLRQRAEASPREPNLYNARTMFDVANLVSDATRQIEQRDGKYLKDSGLAFNASFIIGGQIKGEPPRLMRTFAEGNFIEAGPDTPFFQTGETKYGKPIIERVITPNTTPSEAIKCVLLSFDSTMRSNLSVGMPIDLAYCERDSFALGLRRHLDQGDAYFTELCTAWSEGVRALFRRLPSLESAALEGPVFERTVFESAGLGTTAVDASAAQSRASESCAFEERASDRSASETRAAELAARSR